MKRFILKDMDAVYAFRRVLAVRSFRKGMLNKYNDLYIRLRLPWIHRRHIRTVALQNNMVALYQNFNRITFIHLIPFTQRLRQNNSTS